MAKKVYFNFFSFLQFFILFIIAIFPISNAEASKRDCWKAISLIKGLELRFAANKARESYEKEFAEQEAIFNDTWANVLAEPELFSERSIEQAKRAQQILEALREPADKAQRELEEYESSVAQKLEAIAPPRSRTPYGPTRRTRIEWTLPERDRD